MVFSSLVFLFVYLPVVLGIYLLIPAKWRNIWLFFVNLIFYGWGEPVYILLMLFSICLNYISGLLIARHRDDRRRARGILIVNTVVNLALLVFFKYFDLLIDTFNVLTGSSLPLLHLTLPIGISFYTFQTMSYPIDIYRGDAQVQRNFINFGTFVALFPQLIAGPIVRYKDIAAQLSDHKGSREQFASGVERFTVGLVKKVLIANNVGSLWDIYAATPASELSWLGAWIGALAFSLQIYFDFSGYSDMAIGLGRMLGFEFLENFNYPYISTSVTEFWRRWHISLSSWFRDYVYIPLGGNRRGLARQLLNIAIVWSLTGLWHGANWTFLLWGLYYAVFLVIEKLFLLEKLQKAPLIGHIYTIFVAVCGWVIFQLDNLKEVAVYYRALFGLGQGGALNGTDLFYARSYGLVLLLGVLASTPLLKKLFGKIPERSRRIVGIALMLAAWVLCTAYLVDATYNPFLYFRF